MKKLTRSITGFLFCAAIILTGTESLIMRVSAQETQIDDPVCSVSETADDTEEFTDQEETVYTVTYDAEEQLAYEEAALTNSCASEPSLKTVRSLTQNRRQTIALLAAGAAAVLLLGWFVSVCTAL